jgi:hypothetical protein
MVTTIDRYQKYLFLVVILLACLSTGFNLVAQGSAYNWFYRVYFKDKGDINVSNFSADDLLSQRAINRRQKAGISVPVLSDLSVNRDYLNQVSLKGFYLHCTSKWMNTGLFKTQNQEDINLILSLPFVKDVKIVKKPAAKSSFSDKLDFSVEMTDILSFNRPLTMGSLFTIQAMMVLVFL